MGGDRAPGEIVAGARLAADEGIGVVLVGPPELVGDTAGLDLVECTEVIAMHEDPAQGVRRKKDSSLVRAAELVRDGRASAMVSAGNTGATMASALLRMGRLPRVVRPVHRHPAARGSGGPRPSWSTPGPTPSAPPGMLVQFAQMAAAYSTARYGVAEPSVALLSIGEEATKGTPLVKEAHSLLRRAGVALRRQRRGPGPPARPADVVVTDGFTGNVTLKALEGSLRFLLETLLAVFGTDEETRAASEVLLPHLLPIAAQFDPEDTGGAMLLGVDGVCVISHGSSSPAAMANAVRVAHDLADGGLVAHLAEAVAPG